jgi:hypothetical protein
MHFEKNNGQMLHNPERLKAVISAKGASTKY